MERKAANSAKQIKGHTPIDRSIFGRPPQNSKERISLRGFGYLYVFGRLGGPFKVGCSIDPKVRATQIPCDSPGAYFLDRKKDGVMWLTLRFPDAETAAAAEQIAHKYLRPYELRAPSNLCKDFSAIPGKSEWFNVSLTFATDVAFRAARIVVGGLQLVSTKRRY